MGIKFEGRGEKYRIAVMAILLAACCFLTYYFHAALGLGTVFTHFFYIPIILASLWWKRKGLVVAIFLAVVLISSYIFLRLEAVIINDYFRAGMFIVIAVVVAMLSEQIAKAEGTIKRAYAELGQIFNTAADEMRVIDKDFNMLRVNDAFANLTGISKAEIVGKKCYEVFPGPDCHTPSCTLTRIMGGEERVECEVEKERIDGTKSSSILTATPFRGPGGELIGVVEDFKDITERKQAEEALRETRDYLEKLMSYANAPIVVWDPARRIIRFNHAFERLTNYTADEVIGQDLTMLFPQPSRDESLSKIKRTMSDEYWEWEEIPILRKDGDIRIVLWNSANIYAEDSTTLLATIAQGTDITERKRAEDAVIASKTYTESIIRNFLDTLIVVDPEAKIQTVNPETCDLLGYTEEELIGQPVSIIFAEEEEEEEEGRLFQFFRESEKAEALRPQDAIRNRELTYKTKDGRLIPMSFNASALTDEAGNVTAVVAGAKDITELKLAEAEIRKERTFSGNIIATVPDSLLVLDKDLKIKSPNRSFYEAFQTEAEKVIGTRITDILGDEDGTLSTKLTKLFGTKDMLENFELHYQSEKLGERIFNIRATGIVVAEEEEEEEEEEELVVLQDITERKQAEEALQESNQRYSSLINDVIDSSAVGLFILDADFKVVWINRALERYFGLQRDKVIGKDKRTLIREQIKHTFEEPEIFAEKVLATYDNNTYIEHFECHVVSDGKREERWLEHRSEPIRSGLYSGGRIEHYYDITERKRMEEERRQLEQKAQLASRLASVGEMASGVAHEINNPLTGVIGYSQLLMQKDIPENMKEGLEVIQEGAQRVAGIVKRLLTFARQVKTQRDYVSINEIIETTLALRTYELETNNIKTKLQLDPDLPATIADGGQLQQVFLNLIINAETEMKLAHGKGKLSIKTEKVDDTIRISFKDDGPGIAKENLDRIFHPFFSTREVGEGTGLGLSVCHGIMAEHDGTMSVESQLLKGATFIVELPIVIEPEQLKLAEPATEEPHRVVGARILVVDDEPAVLKFLSQMLTDEGHEVDTADNADDALKKVETERYSLILLDIKMPGMSGIELYKRFQGIAPSLASRVVFITGDVIGTRTTAFLSKTKAPYIAKPFSTAELKKEINRILRETKS